MLVKSQQNKMKCKEKQSSTQHCQTPNARPTCNINTSNSPTYISPFVYINNQLVEQSDMANNWMEFDRGDIHGKEQN